jgi:nucleoside-diphosphate-sugar epimerase
MRVVVLGATGNVGTEVMRMLADESQVTSVLGVARRIPEWRVPKAEWAAADVAEDDLVPLFQDADAVIHLAWLFQPSRQPMVTWRANVEGSANVFHAVASARVPLLVYASSVGAYSPGPTDRPVDESWPTHGWPQAAYTREKAYVERLLDVFEAEHPECRVVRMRPAFTFKRESATQQRRLFAGPFVPGWITRTKVVPDLPGLRLQAVHTADVAEAYRLALTLPVRGAFNLAADPVLDPPELAKLLGATLVRVPTGPVRAGLAVAWALRLVPVPAPLFDAALRMPVMDTSRARAELRWSPRHSSIEAIQEFLSGLREGAGTATAPLAPDTGIAGRIREVASGIGKRP